MSSKVLPVLSFPPWSASFHSHGLRQIIWNIMPAAATQEVPDEAVRFPLAGGGGSCRKPDRGERIFVFCCRSSFESSLMWFILPRSAVVVGDSAPTPRSTHETNAFPWKQTCHAPLGLSNKIHLCREEPAGDPTNLASERWCDFWKLEQRVFWLGERPLSLLDTRASQNLFALFISPMDFLQLYLPPSPSPPLVDPLRRFSTTQFDDSLNADAVREKSSFLLTTFVRKSHGSEIKKLNDGFGQISLSFFFFF